MERVIMVEVIPALFRFGRKEKTHAAPYWVSRGDCVGFERFLKRLFANQRSVIEGRPASAAAVVSQQRRQACPAAAWLVKIFIAMLKLSPYPPMSQERPTEIQPHHSATWPYKFDKWPFLVQACSRCVSPPPTRLVAFPATSVAVWPVRVCARVVDNFLLSQYFPSKSAHTLNFRLVGFRFALLKTASSKSGKPYGFVLNDRAI
jgi:hypothetical protein